MNNIDKSKDFYYYLLSLFHMGSILISMTLTSRIIDINVPTFSYHFRITGGLFFIPVIFFIQDISTEIYGYINTKKMLNINLIIFILYVFQLWFISKFICTESPLQVVAQTLPRHAFSFIISLGIGGTVNNYILAKLKLIFDRKFLAIRFISSTAIGEALFQIVAVLLSWYGAYSFKEILPLALASYLYKILFEILATPLNIYLCRFLRPYFDSREKLHVL